MAHEAGESSQEPAGPITLTFAIARSVFEPAGVISSNPAQEKLLTGDF
jgi:hypothetical protein